MLGESAAYRRHFQKAGKDQMELMFLVVSEEFRRGK
jgi:hypothetical protein